MSNSNHYSTYGAMSTLWTLGAIILSWSVNHSIFWCIVHAICGWFYVLYWIFKYSNIIQYIEQTLLK